MFWVKTNHLVRGAVEHYKKKRNRRTPSGNVGLQSSWNWERYDVRELQNDILLNIQEVGRVKVVFLYVYVWVYRRDKSIVPVGREDP